MSDGRITDYTRTIMTSKATMTHSDENLNRQRLESAINGANNVIIDLEQNYASASAPTSAPDGKIWYDSSIPWFQGRIASAWALITHSGSKKSQVTNYAIPVSDNGAYIELSASVTFAATFTLPSVGSTEDGLIINCINDSQYTLTISPSDNDHVWNSGATYGVELPDQGTMVKLRYDHSNTKWDIINKTGGKVLIEGLVLSEPMLVAGQYNTAAYASVTAKQDLTSRHTISLFGVTCLEESYSKFEPSCWSFTAASSHYASCVDSSDWDLFGDQTTDKTISLWAYHDALGNEERYVVHYEDGSNRWSFIKTNANTLYVEIFTNGSPVLQLSGGSLSAATWTHVALVIKNSSIGLYVNGSQVAYSDSWSTDTFTGALELGRLGSGASYLNGRMQDLHISYNNVYNANPNSGSTDSFTVPAQLFRGVML